MTDDATRAMIADRLSKISKRLGLHENRGRSQDGKPTAAFDHVCEFLEAICDRLDALEGKMGDEK